MSQITLQLTQLMDNIWRVTDNIDLVYSEYDDNKTGKGWYLQQFPGGKCSDLFRNDYEAIKAFKNKTVNFK